jgi:hypothetical protein
MTNKTIFLRSYKYWDKELKGIKSGSIIRHNDELYILFYCEDMPSYDGLPANKKDWYFYELKSETIQRVHPYNNYILESYQNDK